MKISVNGKALALKKGSSFEYISENRLFSGSDDYSLAITFPLKDCPQNVEVFGNINRKDVSLGKIHFDCEIRDKAFYKFGTLTIVELTDTEVKCQFLEGRSEVNFDSSFDDVYINELNLGSPEILDPKEISPDSARFMLHNYVALPWVNNNSSSGLGHNFCHLENGSSEYVWDDDTQKLSYQPFLLYLTTRICEEMKYSYDLLAWNYSKLRYLLVCNTLPDAWDMPGFALALPSWTVTEYFEKLELLLGGEFDIDHRNRSVSFKFSGDVVKNIKPVKIDDVVESYSREISNDNNNNEYINSKNLAYKEEDSLAWKFYGCDWYVNWMKEKHSRNVVTFETMDQLLEQAKKTQDSLWISAGSLVQHFSFSSQNLFYVKEVDEYFVYRYLGAQRIGNRYKLVIYLQNIDNIKSRIVDDRPEASTEEIDFVPVSIDHTDFDHGFCMFLTPGQYDDESAFDDYSFDVEEDNPNNRTKIRIVLPQSVIENGKKDNKVVEYYDRIYVAYWAGGWTDWGKLPCPQVGNMMVADDFSNWWTSDFSFSLDGSGDVSYKSLTEKIDSKTKYTFRFLADSIPNVRAVFFIRGKKYLCEKITASFSEKGMSKLLKGEFYQIID